MKTRGGALLAGLVLAARGSWASPPVSSQFYNAGTVLDPSLARVTSARAAAMGGAFTAVADDASALIVNVGGLGQVNKIDASVQYDSLGDGMSENLAAVAVPVGRGTVGLGLAMYQGGSYQKADDLGNLQGTESLSDLAVLGAYAIRNPKWLGLAGTTGLNVEMVKSAAGGSVLAGGLGTVLQLADGFNAGLSLQHLGPKSNGFGLPAAARIGAAYVVPGLMRVAVDSRLGLADKVNDAGLGFEATPVDALAIRLGYRHALADQGITGLTGVTAGIGGRIGNLALDYAYEPYGGLGTASLVTLSWRMTPWVPAEAVVTTLAPGQQMNVAIMELDAQNVSKGDAAVISDLLRGELVKIHAVNVLERQNMEKILSEHAFQQTGCTSEECAVKLGKLLNVQRMVTGSLGKLGDAYYVTVRVVDIETGRVVGSDEIHASVVGKLTSQLPALATRLAKTMR